MVYAMFASTPHCSFPSFCPRVLLFMRMQIIVPAPPAARASARQHSCRTSQKHGAGTAECSSSKTYKLYYGTSYKATPKPHPCPRALDRPETQTSPQAPARCPRSHTSPMVYCLQARSGQRTCQRNAQACRATPPPSPTISRRHKEREQRYTPASTHTAAGTTALSSTGRG